jgi:fructose-1,6-bisphosphatase/inositol monophosphatase family enzyme
MTGSELSRAERSNLLGLAQQAAHEAGELLRDRLEEVAGGRLLARGASTKSSPTDLVTDVDRASEALIVGSLLRARPDDGIQAEEGSSKNGASGVKWVIDPLDGTINYLYGIPAFAVSIAASVGGRGVIGVVHNPLNGEMFSASLGDGAWFDGVELRLEPTGRPLSEALVGTGFSYRAHERAAQAQMLEIILPSVRDIRRAGAAALDLCSVACGRLDAYYEAGLKPWDLAAGEVIALEAGATVTTAEGLAHGAPTVVVAAPGLEEPLLELLERTRTAGRRPLGVAPDLKR